MALGQAHTSKIGVLGYQTSDRKVRVMKKAYDYSDNAGAIIKDLNKGGSMHAAGGSERGKGGMQYNYGKRGKNGKSPAAARMNHRKK